VLDVPLTSGAGAKRTAGGPLLRFLMTIRLVMTVTLATAFALVGCSGPDNESAATPEDSSIDTAESKASVTMADGTVFNMSIDLCDVAANTDKSEGYIFFLASQQEGLEKLYFRISQSPRPDGGVASLDGILQTSYDDGDAEANYELDAEGSIFTIEGTTISGDIAFSFNATQGENDIFGPSTTGTFTADCS